MKELEQEYHIVTLNNNLYLESYMGSSVIATTNKDNSFKFKDLNSANKVAERYDGEVKTQYDWWKGF